MNVGKEASELRNTFAEVLAVNAENDFRVYRSYCQLSRTATVAPNCACFWRISTTKTATTATITAIIMLIIMR